VKNIFLVHARRNWHSADVHESCLVQAPIRSLRSSNEPPPKQINEDRIKAAARGDKELEELVEAIAKIETETKVNQQLSALLDTTIEDVVNRKKRLRKRFDRLFG
jgi:hypothetical protein